MLSLTQITKDCQNTSAAPVRVGLSKHFHNKENRAPIGGNGSNAWAFREFPAQRITVGQLVKHILSGRAWIPAIFRNEHRTNDNWLQAEFIAVDYDDNVSVSDCLKLPFIRQYALLVHPSASSSASKYKTRVIFRLSEPITGDFERYRLASRAVCAALGLPADPISFKPAQLYYGSTNRIEEPFVNLGAVLPVYVVNDLAAPILAADEAQAAEQQAAWDALQFQTIDITDNRASARVARALQDAANKVASAAFDRTGTVYAQAYRLGRLLAHWPISEADVIHALTDGARANGSEHKYGTAEILRHIHNGIKAGCADPEPLAVPTAPRRNAREKNPLQTQSANDFEPFALPEVRADVTGSTRYLSDLPIPDGDVLLISDTGTGKTEWAARQGIDTSVTHREALSAALSQRFNTENYKSVPSDRLPQVGRLNICLNSLHKTGNRRIGVLMLDEIQQQLTHLGGETFTGSEAETAYNKLCADVRRADRVIAADAYASPVVVNWLKSMRPALQVVVNDYARPRGPLTVHHKKGGALATIWRLADENTGPVVVASSSKELVKDLTRLAADRYGESAVMSVYQDVAGQPEQRAFLEHINQQISNYRVFIYSPTVGSGIDIQTPVRAIVGLFLAEPLTAPECHQMLNRCRNAREVHVHIQRKDGQRETSADVLYQTALENATATGHVAHFDTHGLQVVTDSQRALHRLLAEIEAEDNASKNRLFDHFMTLARGYSSTTYSDYDDKQATAITAEQREQRKAEEKAATLAADAISRDEYRALVESGTYRPEHGYGLLRWEIERAAGQPINTVNYDLLHTPQGRAALYLLTDHLHARVDMLAQSDRDDVQNLPGKRRHYTRRKILLDDLIKRVFGADGLRASVELTAQHITETVNDFLAVSGDEFKRLFNRRADLSGAPVPFLRWIMNRLGLKLESYQVRDGQERRRVYRLEADGLTALLELAATCYARQTDGLSQNVDLDLPLIHVLRQPGPDIDDGPLLEPAPSVWADWLGLETDMQAAGWKRIY